MNLADEKADKAGCLRHEEELCLLDAEAAEWCGEAELVWCGKDKQQSPGAFLTEIIVDKDEELRAKGWHHTDIADLL
ncbi:TPA: hypothetical protein EYO12_03070 [Candidatus Saccharibacteria bacterium]|nr:hypothetical protein [Candidatus Saccharibacteria bacterium]HIO87984.1 hypothetical protein [Candidatus Saccharibacteria bacterium]